MDLKIQEKRIVLYYTSEGNSPALKSLEQGTAGTDWKILRENNSRKIIETAEKSPPDIFLLEISRTDKNCFKLCREIKDSAHLSRIPVLLILDNRDENSITKASEAGAEDFLVKPVDLNKLMDRIRFRLKRRSHGKKPEKKSQQQESLKLSEDLYRILFKRSNDAIFLLETKSGRYLDANKAAETLTGRSVEEIKGLKTRDLSPRGSQDRLEEAQKSDTVSRMGEVEYCRPNGEIRTANLTLVPIEGNLAFGIANDITESKLALAEAEENQAWNVSILENTADSLWALDKNFSMIYANKQFLDVNTVLFGKAPKKGDSLIEQIPEWKREAWIDRYSRAFSGEALSFEESFPNPFQPNTMFYMHYRINPLYLGGKIVGATVFGTDTTEKRQHEEFLQKLDKLQSIGTLAGGLAHDFNNLLTALYGNLSLVKLSIDKDHEANKYLERAEESMDRATSLTGQLLTFSKGGAPQRVELNLKELIEKILELDLSGSNVKSTLEAPEDLWPVLGDRGQLQQVISNLVINAVQAMPEGGVINLRLKNSAQDKDQPELRQGRYVQIMIEDQGSGISRNNLLKIFDPYFTTKESGTGLGLATSFSIVNRHKGRITVDSKEGEGSCFTIWLPAPMENSEEWKEQEDIKTEGILDIKLRERVLLMDDEPLVLEIAQEFLENLGYQVYSVKEGSEAIGAYKRAMDEDNPYDLVILDLTIAGGMGGLETLRGIQSLDPQAHCFVSSGYDDDEVMSDFQRYGFHGKIKKPYRFNELKTILKYTIRQQ